MGKIRILAIGDLHFPFACNKSLTRLYKLAIELQPKIIVQLGDLYDLYSFSKFPRSLNVMTPKHEIEVGRADAEVFWRNMQKTGAKCYQLLGNHDSRPFKKLILSAPEFESIVSLKDLFRFPKVETMNSEREELIIGDILFQHGFRSKLGDHVKHNGLNTVCGHSHHGGVVYHRLGDKTLWELNAGYLGDASSEPLSYTRQRKISNWTLGVGWIDDFGPRFISL